MSIQCGSNCPVVGWKRSEYCPTCVANPANASRREDDYADSEFSARGHGPYDREPEGEKHEVAFEEGEG
jgi:hypothetical protein